MNFTYTPAKFVPGLLGLVAYLIATFSIGTILFGISQLPLERGLSPIGYGLSLLVGALILLGFSELIRAAIVSAERMGRIVELLEKKP